MAEALTRTAGFDAKPASVWQRRLVPRTRLSRIFALNESVQRWAAMFSPARWTTASTPSNSAASIVSGGWIPADFMLVVARRPTHQPAHEVAVGFQRVDQCSADEAGGTGDGNDHGE